MTSSTVVEVRKMILEDGTKKIEEKLLNKLNPVLSTEQKRFWEKHKKQKFLAVKRRNLSKHYGY